MRCIIESGSGSWASSSSLLSSQLVLDAAHSYAREAVQHVWLVDPRAKSVEVFRLDAASYRLVAVHGDAGVVRLEPFDAIELSLSALWPTRAGVP